MTEDGCFEGCWMIHHPCALHEIRRLQTIEAQLRNGVIEPDWMQRVREGGCVPCGDETHSAGYGTVVLKLHSPGPTWARHSDDPPTR